MKTTSGKKKKKKKIDRQKGPLSTPVTEAELDLELDEADLMFGEAIDTGTDADYARVRPAGADRASEGGPAQREDPRREAQVA